MQARKQTANEVNCALPPGVVEPPVIDKVAVVIRCRCTRRVSSDRPFSGSCAAQCRDTRKDFLGVKRAVGGF